MAMNLVNSTAYPKIAAKIRKNFGSSGELTSSSLGKVNNLVLGSSDQADKESATLEYIALLKLLCLGDTVNLVTSVTNNPKLGILSDSMQTIAEGP